MSSGYIVKSNLQHNVEYKKIVFLICLIAAVGGLLFGLDQGFIANSLETIEKVYFLGVEGGERYAAVLASGGVVGALLSGIFARVLGRKRSLILAGLLFSAMSLVSATLPGIMVLSACRFGLGFAVGVASFIVPLYLSETAPANIRGSMGTLFQLMITIGIFLIAVTNVYIIKIFGNSHIALSLMFLVITLFSLILLIGSFFLPESPRWLMLKGRRAQANIVLQKILCHEEDIQNELNEIENTIKSDRGAGLGIIFHGFFFKVLVLGAFLQIFQQLVGINLMIYYSPTIFGYAGMHGMLAMLTVPTAFMLFTFPAIKLVEKWGRKKLLYLGSFVMLATMLAAGLTFAHIGNISDPSQIGPLAKLTLLASVILYIFGFGISWGPVVWLVCSEIFPLEGREIGMTVTTMVNWLFAGVVMDNSLSFMKHYGNASIFFLFAGFCLLSLAFLRFFVPETKGITLEQLESNLKSGVALKNIGNKQKI